MANPKYLRRELAAQYVRETWGIRCSTKYLAKLAVVGGDQTSGRRGVIRFMRPRTSTPGLAVRSDRASDRQAN